MRDYEKRIFDIFVGALLSYFFNNTIVTFGTLEFAWVWAIPISMLVSRLVEFVFLNFVWKFLTLGFVKLIQLDKIKPIALRFHKFMESVLN